MSTVTVRLIKSFEYRNWKPLVLSNLNLDEMTLMDLARIVKEHLDTDKHYEQYRSISFDCWKIHSQPHGAKTSNPVINLSDDYGSIMEHSPLPLSQLGFQHETEVSYFNRLHYEVYKLNPVTKW